MNRRGFFKRIGALALAMSLGIKPLKPELPGPILIRKLDICISVEMTAFNEALSRCKGELLRSRWAAV